MERQSEADLLVLLDEIIEKKNGQWGAKDTKDKVNCLIINPLVRRMQAEKRSDDVLERHIKALKRLASNPSHLHEFTKLVLTGEYLHNDFAVSDAIFSQQFVFIPSQVMSLSTVNSLGDFNRLGFHVNNVYLIDEVLPIVITENFKSQHSCSFSDETNIKELTQKLLLLS